MSTLFLTRSEGLPVNLPSATTAKTERPARVTVTIDKAGNLLVNREPVQIQTLKDAVRKKQQPNQSLTVVLNIDEAVTHGQVVAVMDKVRQIPGAKLAIATKKP
ncbi:biopolymer transport protein ExbD/TolR [Calothrix sp. NIES-4071]|nr:biopolymer transport protein ExbD/TolR [Calothrix sp. NIES-4071]BAZ56505.1 biopolymer transport protein ExbD/TolR [Calothrix sp. NIES-4105]